MAVAPARAIGGTQGSLVLRPRPPPGAHDLFEAQDDGDLARLPSPEAAFETTLRLNNRYFLDGRDANSFTNVAWVFGL